MSKKWVKGDRVAIQSEPQYKGSIIEVMTTEAERGSEQLYKLQVDKINSTTDAQWFVGDALITEKEAEIMTTQVEYAKEIKS